MERSANSIVSSSFVFILDPCLLKRQEFVFLNLQVVI